MAPDLSELQVVIRGVSGPDEWLTSFDPEFLSTIYLLSQIAGVHEALMTCDDLMWYEGAKLGWLPKPPAMKASKSSLRLDVVLRYRLRRVQMEHAALSHLAW